WMRDPILSGSADATNRPGSCGGGVGPRSVRASRVARGSFSYLGWRADDPCMAVTRPEQDEASKRTRIRGRREEPQHALGDGPRVVARPCPPAGIAPTRDQDRRRDETIVTGAHRVPPREGNIAALPEREHPCADRVQPLGAWLTWP